AMAAQKEFDAALYTLSTVPDVCKECFDKATDMIPSVFKSKLDNECGENLAAAEAAWAERNASLAAEYLSYITSDTKCYSDAVKLRNSIASKLDEIDKREWDLKVKKEYDLKAKEIEAARAVGVAYGQNQQPINITYKTLW
ncbi:MAG: hypothetical protein ILP24_03915, partial [Paludibacteraceae bacterium]|nr:hypothetical protein [Paludibacteraceae bacterium]